MSDLVGNPEDRFSNDATYSASFSPPCKFPFSVPGDISIFIMAVLIGSIVVLEYAHDFFSLCLF